MKRKNSEGIRHKEVGDEEDSQVRLLGSIQSEKKKNSKKVGLNASAQLRTGEYKCC